MHSSDIRHFLEITLAEAQKAFDAGDYPVGSLVIDSEGKILSQQRNRSFSGHDVSAHPEMLNLRDVGWAENLTLFSSLEPCYGCSFFIARSNIKTIYSALKDPHKGGMSNLKSQSQFANFFEDIELITDPIDDLIEKSRELMRQYFIHIGREDKAKFYTI